MTRRAWRKGSGLALFFVPVGLWAASGAPHIDRVFVTTLTPEVTVINMRGRVVVRCWDKPRIHAVCVASSPRIEIDGEQMPAAGQAERLHFATHVVERPATLQEETADFTLEIPAGASLEVRNPEGSVLIQGLKGDGWVETVGGAITVRDDAGHLVARSIAGDIEIVRQAGRAEVSSVTGNLHFLDSTTPQVRADTSSGRILYEGDFAPAGEYVLTSYSGDMTVLCPPSASFELRSRTVRGKLDNQLRLIPRPHFGMASTYLRNSGRASLRLNSYSGTIHIEPRH